MKVINYKSSNYYYFLFFYLFLSLLLISFNVINKEFNRKISLEIQTKSDQLFLFFTQDLIIVYQNFFLTQQIIETLRSNNKKLNVEIAQLNNQVLEIDILERKIKQLNSLLHIKNNKNLSQIITTKVINKDIYNLNTILNIPLGKFDNIKLNSLVISQDGIVGYIIDMYNNNAKIITTINPLFKISAHTEISNVNVVINGNGTLNPDLTIYSANHKLQNGENLLTSGLEGYFPQNILIGKVIAVKNKQWKVDLFEKFSHINYVHIVN